ncbi:hypothetical protein ACFL4X_02580 [Gemmatimonadota bacterium]
MRRYMFLIYLLFVQGVFAQGIKPEDWGLKAFQIKDAQLGTIDFYVTDEGIDQEKPLIFVAQGSGGLPSMIHVQFGEKFLEFGALPADPISRLSDKFHVAYMGKAGTPFCDTIKVEKLKPMEIFENWQPTEEYIRNCGMEWQVEASSVVVDSLCKMLPIAGDKVIALGMSEGGRIVPRLAIENQRITHVVSMISGGLNQFYSSIINKRIDAATGKYTHQEAQTIIDSLFCEYEKIYSDPQSTDKSWYGHPYKRWGSFCTDIPLEHLVKLEIPIYLLSGSADRNAPVLQADYVKLEFLRLGKANLTYSVLPGVEHSLYEVVEVDGKEKGISHKEEVFGMVAEWIAAN